MVKSKARVGCRAVLSKEASRQVIYITSHIVRVEELEGERALVLIECGCYDDLGEYRRWKEKWWVYLEDLSPYIPFKKALL